MLRLFGWFLFRWFLSASCKNNIISWFVSHMFFVILGCFDRVSAARNSQSFCSRLQCSKFRLQYVSTGERRKQATRQPVQWQLPSFSIVTGENLVFTKQSWYAPPDLIHTTSMSLNGAVWKSTKTALCGCSWFAHKEPLESTVRDSNVIKDLVELFTTSVFFWKNTHRLAPWKWPLYYHWSLTSGARDKIGR